MKAPIADFFNGLIVFAALIGGVAEAQLVPGSGELCAEVGDDFEDAKWQWVPNSPKSSKNIDEQRRLPAGYSTNGRWAESMLRGSPDLIRRVPTPEGGLEGSSGSLMIRTLVTGVPGRPSYSHQQDDLIVNCSGRLRGMIPVGWSPNTVVRVYVPPFDEWEKRTGTSFGFRAELWATSKGKYDKDGNRKGPEEPYWPGFFIQLTKANAQNKEDSAMLLMRGGTSGHDLSGPAVTPGWWTLGMSFTPDGRVHYYAHAGVEDLTSADLITSQFPYGFHALRFQSIFFNVSNNDDGRNWTTAWIIDDPQLYFTRNGGSVAQKKKPHQMKIK